MILIWKTQRTCGRSCPSVTLFTTNLIQKGLGSKPGPCGEKPATNHLSRQTAVFSAVSVKLYRNKCHRFSKFGTFLYTQTRTQAQSSWQQLELHADRQAQSKRDTQRDRQAVGTLYARRQSSQYQKELPEVSLMPYVTNLCELLRLSNRELDIPE